MRKKIFVVLLLVVVLITSVGCNHESNPKAYQLDYYMDTILYFQDRSAIL